MKYFIFAISLLSVNAVACMDCGGESPIPERDPELLLVDSVPGLKVLEVDAVLDTNIEGKPENIRIINKSSNAISEKLIIKSIESVKFITQGGKDTCHAHLKKNVYYKYKFQLE